MLPSHCSSKKTVCKICSTYIITVCNGCWAYSYRAISGNMFIEFVCFPVCDVINFETEISFLPSCFPTWSGENVRRIIYRSSKWKELFLRTFIQVNKTNFYGGRESEFKDYCHKVKVICKSNTCNTYWLIVSINFTLTLPCNGFVTINWLQ